MSYSISQIVHPHKDKDGRQKIQIRIIYNRARVYLKTDFKTGSPNPKINAIVKKQISEAEDRLLDAIREGLTTTEFKILFKQEKAKSILLTDYIKTVIEKYSVRFSEGTIKHFRSLCNKVGSVTLSEISVPWLEKFERGLVMDSNSVNANMKRLKSILSKAWADGFIKEGQFRKYKVPPYKQKLVEYLTESEIEDFAKVVRAVKMKSKQIAGWYFLLSCYTGWRISDAKRFDKTKIQGSNIVIRATKNKELVSFPIIPRLKEVLNFVVKNPFNIAEQAVREFVKEIAKDAGITKKVKYHTARHSFGNLLAVKGFDVKQIAEKMGDSELIAKIYIRVHNEPLNKLIRERLG